MTTAPTTEYPSRVRPPERRAPGFRPPPGGRLHELKVTYYPGTVPFPRGKAIDGPYDVWGAFQNLAYETVEVFRVAFLDCHLRLMAFEDIARGTVDRCCVHPREVFHSAVQLRASAVIVMHNHPNGDLGASERDVALTRKLRKAGEILGIELIDHLIIGATGFYSMRHHGWK